MYPWQEINVEYIFRYQQTISSLSSLSSMKYISKLSLIIDL